LTDVVKRIRQGVVIDVVSLMKSVLIQEVVLVYAALKMRNPAVRIMSVVILINVLMKFVKLTSVKKPRLNAVQVAVNLKKNVLIQKMVYAVQKVKCFVVKIVALLSYA
jgi:xanthosine utilization system XapX-like protein